MKTTVDNHAFVEAFRAYDRTDNFSVEALDLLFEYLEQYEQDSGQELELDVIAICCDFYEQDARSVNSEYDLELDLDDLDDDEAAEAVAEALNDHTSVVGTTSAGTVIFQAF